MLRYYCLLPSEDIFIQHAVHELHDYRLIIFRPNGLCVHCIANKTDKYDPEAFIIYNELCFLYHRVIYFSRLLYYYKKKHCIITNNCIIIKNIIKKKYALERQRQRFTKKRSSRRDF